MSAHEEKFCKFMHAITTISPDTICAMANDAAERKEAQAEANFFPVKTMRYTLFLVAYLSRRDELKYGAMATDAIEKAKSGGGSA